MHAEAKLSVSNRDIPYSLRDENTSALGGIFLVSIIHCNNLMVIIVYNCVSAN